MHAYIHTVTYSLVLFFSPPQGYDVRAKQLEVELLAAFDQWKRAEVDLTCYKQQQDQERRALKQRLAIRRY